MPVMLSRMERDRSLQNYECVSKFEDVRYIKYDPEPGVEELRWIMRTELRINEKCRIVCVR